MNQKLVKKIHYCWFGGKEKSNLILNNIKTWKQYFSDWEIIEWNETNFKIEEFPFLAKAKQKKDWAFIADFARVFVVYNEGGIYFDTDMIVNKSFENILAPNKFNTGFGLNYPGAIATFYAPKNHEVTKKILEYLLFKKKVYNKFGLLHETINNVFAKILINFFNVPTLHEVFETDKLKIFPNYYWDLNILDQNYCEHLCYASWVKNSFKNSKSTINKYLIEKYENISKWKLKYEKFILQTYLLNQVKLLSKLNSKEKEQRLFLNDVFIKSLTKKITIEFFNVKKEFTLLKNLNFSNKIEFKFISNDFIEKFYSSRYIIISKKMLKNLSFNVLPNQILLNEKLKPYKIQNNLMNYSFFNKNPYSSKNVLNFKQLSNISLKKLSKINSII